MDKKIREILDDLYAFDPALRGREDELKKTARRLLASRPDTRFDERFRRELREKLLEAYGTEKAPAERRRFRGPLFQWRYAAALTAVLIAVVVIPPLIRKHAEKGTSPALSQLESPGDVLLAGKQPDPARLPAEPQQAAKPDERGVQADVRDTKTQARPEISAGKRTQEEQTAVAAGVASQKLKEETARSNEAEASKIKPATERLSPQDVTTVTAQMPQLAAGIATGEIRGKDAAAPTARFYEDKEAPPAGGFSRLRRDEDWNTEAYDRVAENDFLPAVDNPLSTFSVDVDTASYANVRRFLSNGQLPPADAVRIEEMVNYFAYDYPLPKKGEAFSITTELAACPWNRAHQLVLVGLQGRDIPADELPPSNLVFLIDVSGSMNAPNKLPLLKDAFRLLVRELDGRDRVAIVVYAGSAGLVLPSTKGERQPEILDALRNLQAGGSTAGGAGIRLAYKTAAESFIEGGNNRVILATDGDFNVGASSDAEMERLIEDERQRGIFLTVLGFGMGNYKDAKMEKLADKGNGNYAYIDSLLEANKVLVTDIRKTLFTIAKDVKIQVEFNPAHVESYRLVGYENRLMKKEDFEDDTKDAGEIGSGHTVTAFYEIVPAGAGETPAARELKYQTTRVSQDARESREIMTVKVRYKKPDGATSALVTRAVDASPLDSDKTSDNFRFAASVVEFGLLLRDSRYKGTASFESLISRARAAAGEDPQGYRHEFTKLARTAEILMRNRDGRGE